MPGDHVAVRWQGDYLVAVIELMPRPFTPTVIVNGDAVTDDTVSTKLVEKLLRAHCPDLEADVVSAGYRVGKTAPASLVALYEQVVGPYPAPANRRTWIVLRADPEKTRRSAQRRDSGCPGWPATCGIGHPHRRSVGQQWNRRAVLTQLRRLRQGHRDQFREGNLVGDQGPQYLHRGLQRARRPRRVVVGSCRSHHDVRADPSGSRADVDGVVDDTVQSDDAAGFSCLYGGQRAALQGLTPVTDKHYDLPIGSAGVLVGETSDRYPVYMPFDNVDVSINLGDARLFTQFVIRSAASGAVVTLSPQFREFATMINGRVGRVPRVAWPNATTYLGPHQGVGRVILRPNFIDTPRHRQLPITLINPREESRYQMALEQ